MSAVVVLVIGVVALGLAWLAAFGLAWEQRPLSMTMFAVVSALFGAAITIRGLMMIVRVANHRSR